MQLGTERKRPAESQEALDEKRVQSLLHPWKLWHANSLNRPEATRGSVGMALVGWWFESLLVHSGVSFFFPSSMADVALWLGPYRSISSQKRLQGPRRSISAGKSQQIKKQKTKQTNKTTRKSPNQSCVSSKQKTDQTHKRGRSPNKNTHQQDLPEDTRESQVRPAERQRAPTKKNSLNRPGCPLCTWSLWNTGLSLLVRGVKIWVHHPSSAYSRPHPYTKKQGHGRASSWLSPARRSPPSHLLRPDFWITALLVHAPRPMAPGQDHHRHGEAEPVGLQVVQTLLRWWICQANGRTALTQACPGHCGRASSSPDHPPQTRSQNDWIFSWMDGHSFNASIARTGSEGTSPFLYDAQGILV